MPDRFRNIELPETNKQAFSRNEMNRVIASALMPLVSELRFVKMAAMAYIRSEAALRVIATFGFEQVNPIHIVLPMADYPELAKSLETSEILILHNVADSLPEILARHFDAPVAVLPLSIGERRIGVFCGQPEPGVSLSGSVWRDMAETVSEKAALVAECLRLYSINQDMLQQQVDGRAVTVSILENKALEDVLDLIVGHIVERFEIDRVGIYTIDETGPSSIMMRNVPSEYGDAVRRHVHLNPILRRMATTQDPFLLDNVSQHPDYAPFADVVVRAGIGSIIVAPIKYGRTVEGALCLYPREHRSLTPFDSQMLRVYGDHIAMAIALSNSIERQRETAALRERTRLAREIHDTLAQTLTGLVLQLEAAEEIVANQPETARSWLAEARTLAGEALEETRRSVMGLTPTPLEQMSLPQALAHELTSFGHQARMRTAFASSGDEEPLAIETKTALFRIAQEALNNIRKHAEAARVRAALHYGEEHVTLLVEDDGVGFDASTATVPGLSGGYGIFSMKERARMLGGEVKVESTEGWGTRVIARLPYEPPVNRALYSEPEQSRNAVATRPDRAPSRKDGSAARSSPSTGIRVLIADDHSLAREGIRRVLESQQDITVVGEAADGAEAIERAMELKPDVLLMDIQMPRLNGIQALRKLKTLMPDLPVVILTSFSTEETLMDCVKAGACGYLLKDTSAPELGSAIRAAHRGESQVHPVMTAKLLDSIREERGGKGRGADLNEREREILRLLATGARNKEIAAKLFITEKTVESHLSNLFGKLGVANRTEAARVAMDRGLIEIDNDGNK